MKSYIFLATFALMSCEKKSLAPTDSGIRVVDDGLRGLYSVNSICGSFVAPEGSSHYILTTLEFENGTLIRCGPMFRNSTESLHGGSSTAQFLWGEQGGKNRTALVAPGFVSRADNDFWCRLMTTTNFADGSGPEYDGYKILGMGQSDMTRVGIGDMGFGRDFDRALKERMAVGVLAVRFFTSKQQMEEFPHPSLVSQSKTE